MLLPVLFFGCSPDAASLLATSPRSHVDNFCCFIRPGEVALAWPNDENDFNDPQYEISMNAYERLSNTTDAKGRKLKIWKVPCPPAMFRTYKESGGILPDHLEKGYVPRIPGERLPASYMYGGELWSRAGCQAVQYALRD